MIKILWISKALKMDSKSITKNSSHLSKRMTQGQIYLTKITMAFDYSLDRITKANMPNQIITLSTRAMFWH